MTWQDPAFDRIDQRRIAWRHLVATDPETAAVQMRVAGHTITAIASETDLAPPHVEQLLAQRGLVGPWEPGWRRHIARAA